jgi:adenylate cyclase
MPQATIHLLSRNELPGPDCPESYSKSRPRPRIFVSAATCATATDRENPKVVSGFANPSVGGPTRPPLARAGMSIETNPELTLLPRNEAVVLVVDLVESVRLMQANEQEAVERWHSFLRRARDEVLPQQGGRLVKSLGDGLMAEFQSPSRAVVAALALHALLAEASIGFPEDRQMFLRAALHTTRIYADDLDIYGSGVNLAARLATLAGPGETVVSATVRDGLTDGLDAHIEDLGDCHLKHIAGPVRAYRVGHAGARPVMAARRDYTASYQPTIAVIPFAMRTAKPEHYSVGELIADGVIAGLSRARHLRVISRLSTTAFRDRDADVSELNVHLNASYVLSGSYTCTGDRLMVSWELADVRDHLIVGTDHLQVRLGDLLEFEGELIHAIAAMAHDAILSAEVARSLNRPLPTLESYALLLGGIQLLHRSSKRDFERSFELLTHLAEKHPRSAEPKVWQAKWYALRSVQGLTEDREHDTRAALACTAAALQHEPQNSFALAMEGFVHCHLSRDYDLANERLSESIRQNPSESFGHLFKAVIQGLTGDFNGGLESFAIASATSPLDPARYLFDTIGAYLHFCAGHHSDAVSLAKRSLRQNRHHAHSWRVLVAAEAESGDLESARFNLRSLLEVQKGLTVEAYLAAGKRDDPLRLRVAAGLGAAGLPTH